MDNTKPVCEHIIQASAEIFYSSFGESNLAKVSLDARVGTAFANPLTKVGGPNYQASTQTV